MILKRMFLMIGVLFLLTPLTGGYVAYAQQGSATAAAPNSAAEASKLCAGQDGISQLFCSKDLPDMLNSIFQIAIQAGAILALLRIAYAGYLYMGSADMWSNKQQAKDTFRDAIVGLLILLSIWLVLYQINPCILSLHMFDTSGKIGTSQQCGAYQSPSP